MSSSAFNAMLHLDVDDSPAGPQRGLPVLPRYLTGAGWAAAPGRARLQRWCRSNPMQPAHDARDGISALKLVAKDDISHPARE
jgi:hypothetical protein